MSKAALMRLTIGVLGTVVTGFAATTSGLGTGTMLLAIVAGFIVTGLLADAAFRAYASPEEVRRDLEDRVRNSD